MFPVSYIHDINIVRDWYRLFSQFDLQMDEGGWIFQNSLNGKKFSATLEILMSKVKKTVLPKRLRAYVRYNISLLSDEGS